MDSMMELTRASYNLRTISGTKIVFLTAVILPHLSFSCFPRLMEGILEMINIAI